MTSEVTIRQATLTDLPSIHGLIQESFGEMEKFLSIEQMEIMSQAKSTLIATELSDHQFISTYLNDAFQNNFWVALVKGVVAGCIAIKRVRTVYI